MRLKINFFLILGLVILGLAGYGYLRATPGVKNQTETRPIIEITPQTFDFGEVKYGQIVSYSFKVKNLGKAILNIKRVSTSCGCTTARVSQETVSPGEETALLVTYDTGAMGGSHGRGKQERIIYTKSNDPAAPQVEVKIYANVY